MRLVTVTSPTKDMEAVRRAAFEVGISSVSVRQQEKYGADGSREITSAVEIQTSTPKAKKLIGAILAAPYYTPAAVTIVVRQPRSILSSDSIRSLTEPLAEPGADLLEELWQFSQVTYGLVGRVLAASLLLGYGLLEQSILLIIAGLMFLPLLPMLLAMSLGITSSKFSLALQGLFGFAVSIALVIGGTALVGALAGGPIRYNDFHPLPVSLMISAVVGMAAGLTSIDDAGRRELIGLAAAAQIGILPAWLGLTLVVGRPPTPPPEAVAERIVSLLANAVSIVSVAGAVIAITGVAANARLVAKGQARSEVS